MITNSSTNQTLPFSLRSLSGLFLLSAATLLFEINLTRLFSVSQFYHFAFLIVSLALLGLGASGTFLAIAQNKLRATANLHLAWLALGSAVCMLFAYLLINWLPFDSFSIAWDRRQIGLLALHYLALASPFFFSGLLTGLLLTARRAAVGKTYAFNLGGSALGCVLALFVPHWIAGEGVITLSSLLAVFAALVLVRAKIKQASLSRWIFIALTALLIAFNAADLGLRLTGRPSFAFLQLNLSPYKGLSQILRTPHAEIITQEWNAISRVDLVSSPSLRSLAGLSYRYPATPPHEWGLLVDGDNLSPVVLPGQDPTYNAYLPAAIAFQLHPGASVLLLEPHGGVDILLAQWGAADRITIAEPNPLIPALVPQIYTSPGTTTVLESPRSFLRRTSQTYDIILLSLTEGYHPIRSGAYSLAEDYSYTVEAFSDALRRLEPHGLFIVPRWLQMPPSEFLRAFAIAVTALEENGLDPGAQIVALRGYNLGLMMLKASPYTPHELSLIRSSAAALAYDLVYAPDMSPEDANRYNILEEPLYYQTFTALLNTRPRSNFYQNYEYDVSPPTDDHPFFGHYFKWSQAGQVLAEFGKVWSPFGGAGYFVLLALLLLTLFLSALIILLPVAFTHFTARIHASRQGLFVTGGYFGFIGLGYLLIEIPLIQQYIFYLNQPAYALTCVLFSLLLFSGVGSLLSERIPHKPALVLLVISALLAPIGLSTLIDLTLGWALPLRMVAGVLSLAPLGFLMGIPFASGLRKTAEALMPWAWGINGALSVLASVLAALLSISFGLHWVLMAGALCYSLALACLRRFPSEDHSRVSGTKRTPPIL